ncbi:MAG: hypothetical protein CMG60_03290 [Candidatus Marinimicrobia bacterium]|nr:hypothetical protein [Candidatus Neomarinimicrobiota bacterium]|tara:strand:- start:64 stop:465 length:402 start_codon:yes stop_codon:yes gene_type:complete
MAKKQKSFADKAAGNSNADSVYAKYVKSVQSEVTGQWRFNEQMVRMNKGEQLDAALKRMDEVANLVDIDLSEFESIKQDDVPNTEATVEKVKSSSNEDINNDENSDKNTLESSPLEEEINPNVVVPPDSEEEE